MPHQDGVNTSGFVKGGVRLVGGLRKIKQMDKGVMFGGRKRSRERGHEQTRARFDRQPCVNARSPRPPSVPLGGGGGWAAGASST